MTDSEKPAIDMGAASGTETPQGRDAAPKTESGPSVPEPPKSENAEESLKFGKYEIIPPKREMPETGFVADPEALSRVMAALNGTGRKGAGAPEGKKQAPLGHIEALTKSKTGVYAAVSIVLGLLAGLIVAVLVLHPNSKSEPTDMGSVIVNQYGLRGNLTAHWKDGLDYEVTIEPSDASTATAFATNVNASQKPLSIDLQAKDPFGAVLCSATILLRFDPRNTPVDVAPDPGANGSYAQKKFEAGKQLSIAGFEGKEIEREQGKTIFHNDTGKNGQLTSISAEGVLPCTKEQFEKFAAWGFTSNFPTINASSQSLAVDSNVQAAADGRSKKELSAANPAVNSKGRRKQAVAPPPISIEGDDTIEWIDASSGAIETRGGKELLADKADAIASMLKGRDFPIPIHYRCDQEGNCTFSGVGVGTHRARLRR